MQLDSWSAAVALSIGIDVADRGWRDCEILWLEELQRASL